MLRFDVVGGMAMKPIYFAWCIAILSITIAWLSVEPRVFMTSQFIPLRNLMVQFTGLLAIVAMSVAMILSARPLWPERSLNGLDKMYRLHKWLGISALVFAILHWLASSAPKWGIALGLLERGQRPPAPYIADPIAQLLASYRGIAESVGELAFYASIVLLVVALTNWVPYRLFYKTHRLMAAAYLALVFHAIVLTKFSYWLTPVGIILAPLLLLGTWSAFISLLGLIGKGRRALGTISALQDYPGVHVLEVVIDVPEGWHGHKPGQFAFVKSDPSEGPHPYTIASAWDDKVHSITFLVKALGDHTKKLSEKLAIGQTVQIEGPYGCFTFDDDSPEQIWIGAGIGITPLVARMKHLAAAGSRTPQKIHLFHPTADRDDQALTKLAADASAAGVNLYVLVDSVDGFLDGTRIRKAVPGWRDASIWYCGPAGLGNALHKDFGAAGFALDERFHQELFALR